MAKLKEAKLRGRGGAGFLTYIKWQKACDTQSTTKYVICNADEGDPGAFMDRMLIESFPYRLIEGILIASYTIKANKAIIYVREEYAKANQIINKTLKICREKQIFKKINEDFDITVFKGAGAFVCGEETALIASIEGKRGIPRSRPPYPVEQGLFQKTTLINNVETLCTIPWLILNPAKDFINLGNGQSTGTKTFALAGKVQKPGLIEVPMGITINDIIYDIAGGPLKGRTIKAVQIGGPSGGCIPASMFDLKIDFDSLNQSGAIMGSGGLVVLDDTDCMVDMALYFVKFAVLESCGKCTFCRIGLLRMTETLELICSGKGTEKDLVELEDLCNKIKLGSFCGLGKTAPNPVLTTLKYFKQEYIEHIKGKCPACKCRELIHYYINDNCIGCTKCAQNCSAGAIEFRPYQKHEIDQGKCVKCGVCRMVCPQNAVDVSDLKILYFIAVLTICKPACTSQ